MGFVECSVSGCGSFFALSAGWRARQGTWLKAPRLSCPQGRGRGSGSMAGARGNMAGARGSMAGARGSMAGASPATTIRGQRLFQRGIGVAPLAGAMPPLRMLCSLTQKFEPDPNMPDSTISSIRGGILGLFISYWCIYGYKLFDGGPYGR